jgi:hypothetical protein
MLIFIIKQTNKRAVPPTYNSVQSISHQQSLFRQKPFLEKWIFVTNHIIIHPTLDPHVLDTFTLLNWNGDHESVYYDLRSFMVRYIM